MNDRRTLIEGTFTIQEAVAMGFSVHLSNMTGTRMGQNNNIDVIGIMTEYDMLIKVDRNKMR